MESVEEHEERVEWEEYSESSSEEELDKLDLESEYELELDTLGLVSPLAEVEPPLVLSSGCTIAEYVIYFLAFNLPVQSFGD